MHPFSLISITNAALAYQGQPVFAQVNLDLIQGQWISLLGPSGIGKTSLLRMIAGLTSKDENISGCITTQDGLPLSQHIAYLAQTDLLLPWLSALDNAILGTKLRPNTREALSQAKVRALTLLRQVGLENANHLYPHQLSGGMRQRVALIRTLMEDKPIILMDEPFSALDAITRYKLQNVAAELLKNKTVLFITHDPMEALRLSNLIYVMQGNPATLHLVATLDTESPRELNDPTLIQLQALLFKELAQASEANK